MGDDKESEAVMAVPPAAIATQPTYCPVDRYKIEDLAARIKLQNTRLSADGIVLILKKEVNFPPQGLPGSDAKDKLAREHAGRFTAEDSISAFEAYVFTKKLKTSGGLEGTSTQAVVGRSMLNVFFGGSLSNLPPSHQIKIATCHDGDTCTVIESQVPVCNAGAVTESVRTSGIDSPEVGYYMENKETKQITVIWSERLADGLRGRKSPYTDRSAPPANPNGPWLNPKLVENVDKIHLELAKGRWDPRRISYEERSAMNAIIAVTHDYTGRIARLPREDLIGWEFDQSRAGAELMMESQIRWTSDDTPAALCGTLQTNDIYGRRLSSFEQMDRTRLSRFIRTRLATLMKTQGQRYYDIYQGLASSHLATLERTRIPGLAETAKRIVAQASNPAIFYTDEKCRKMADAFDYVARETGGVSANDDQVMQIITGSTYDYLKYRNQRGDIYKKAGDLARQQKFGLWGRDHARYTDGEITFNALWKANSTNPRYNPADCMK